MTIADLWDIAKREVRLNPHRRRRQPVEVPADAMVIMLELLRVADTVLSTDGVVNSMQQLRDACEAYSAKRRALDEML